MVAWEEGRKGGGGSSLGRGYWTRPRELLQVGVGQNEGENVKRADSKPPKYGLIPLMDVIWTPILGSFV